MPAKKFHTRILDVCAEEVVRSALLAGGLLTHPRRLCTEWFFMPIDEPRAQVENRLEPRRWVSLTTSTDGVGVLSATTIETPKVGGRHEVKAAVSSADDVLRVLAHLGHEPRTCLSWFATTYQLGRAVLSIDEMPGGFTWLSIEGPEAGCVFEVVSVLGFEPDQHRPMSVMEAYRHCAVAMLDADEISFTCPPEGRS